MKRLIIIYLLLLTGFCKVSGQEELELTKYFEGTVINDIIGDDNYIWIATEGKGVYQYDRKNDDWENYSNTSGGLQQDFIYCIEANDKFVWAGSVDGLFIMDKARKRWTKRKFSKGGQLSNWIRSLAYDKYSDVVWIGRFKYLTKYDIKRRRFTDYDLTIRGDEKTNTIKAVAVDGDSLVWFGTEGGLHKYDKSKDLADDGAVVFYDSKMHHFNGDGDKISITSLLFEQNNIWIGLDEFRTDNNPNYNIGGLYKFDRRNEWYRFDNSLGFQANGVFDIEGVGDIIFASLYQFGRSTKKTYGRGIAKINRNTLELNQINDNRLPDKILTIHFDGEYLWLGSDSGVFKLKLTNSFANWNFGE